MAQKFFSAIFFVALMVAGCFGNAQTDARAELCNDYLNVADKKIIKKLSAMKLDTHTGILLLSTLYTSLGFATGVCMMSDKDWDWDYFNKAFLVSLFTYASEDIAHFIGEDFLK